MFFLHKFFNKNNSINIPNPYIGKNGPINTPLFIKCFGGTTNHIHSTSYIQPISA